ANNPPLGNVESLHASGSDSIQVSGWAFDPDSPESGSIHVYVDGRGYAYQADLDRPDVGNVYRRPSKVGFSQTVKTGPGAHDVCVYAIDSVGGVNRLLTCTTVNVAAARSAAPAAPAEPSPLPAPPAGLVSPEPSDEVTAEPVPSPSPSPSHDEDAVTPEPSTDGPADDPSSGAGTAGPDDQVAPFTAGVDVAEGLTGQMRIAGWARAEGTPGAVPVTIRVDGVPVALPASAKDPASETASDTTDGGPEGSAVDDDPFSMLADLFRPSAGGNAAYGFDVVLTATAGTHEVCVLVTDDPDERPLVCRTVTVG
ncbi:hypothetical protein ACFVRJ_06960, partial [Oerskovia jenensis]